MLRWFHLLIRIVVCLAVTCVLLWGGNRFLGLTLTPSANSPDPAGGVMLAMIWLAGAVMISLIWLGMVGRPFVDWFAGKWGGLLLPSDDSFEVHPQYSIAEARVHEGRYAEAIETFREYILKYPNEAFPHLRIAELQLEHMGDPEAAMEELKTAVSKTRGPDAFALANHRLADLHLAHRRDTPSALDCLREIQRQYPKTKQARAALERAERLLRPSSAVPEQ